MATRYSPKTATDGLLFYYDTGNSKSYRGKPTTNLAPYISTHGTSDFDLPSLPPGVSIIHSKGAIISGTTDWADIFNTSGYSIPNGERLVVSAWVYIPADKVNNRFNINADINGNNTGLASWHDLEAGRWHKLRGSWLNSTGATANATATRLEPWTPVEWTGGNNTAYAVNFMVESGTYDTAYEGSQALPANTTRSATEGLLDFTKNATIDITNVSFDSDAQITFDGSNDRVDMNAQNLVGATAGTVSAWINLSEANVNHAGIFCCQVGPAWADMRVVLNISSPNRVRLAISDGTNSTTDNCRTNSTLSYNTWYHIAATYDGTSAKIYVNGVLDKTFNTTITPGIFTPGATMVGSQNYSNRYFNGDIAAVSTYNKALSAEEVQGNFNSIRNRFGI